MRKRENSTPDKHPPQPHAGHDDSCGCGLLHLLEGVDEFTQHVFPGNKELFQSLAHSQAPHTLFITCADSRVSPEMITQTRPGELFVCRNIGNIVPAYGEMLGGVSAVVEFAVLALNVQQIVLCGHTDCGAMKGLASGGAATTDMPTVHAWLRNAEAARSVVQTRGLEGDAVVQALVEENVRLQLTHLSTHPAVAARVAQGRLRLQGWVYDIGHGKVAVLDEAHGSFQSLAEARARLQRKLTAK
ncbi:carbonic anhydrase [Paraburkholderia caballeronis]|uniref:Carbonic anhydrase n=1 Tax=Paraburkholderia caballeronis TaxID=416943 RepID=A0A1H7NW77_9BURK|nr:carbonic anhydrase [Paraburkholderia caballeronis]PXW25502.1 carbonic anhydrase [Paraburkholderia caballeronis]PXX01109.1 carbonic anhydrase [Paraburkholderia caballeronis]RAJ99538.1 carbonic anhydrase [Paraburkholderia caballeronis]TDV34143.1 carbonic anhydrase [Paraburkholderia caballeronis]SEE34837.1 carbonic anhydrase [Paraburkholderia caballeronis]